MSLERQSAPGRGSDLQRNGSPPGRGSTRTSCLHTPRIISLPGPRRRRGRLLTLRLHNSCRRQEGTPVPREFEGCGPRAVGQKGLIHPEAGRGWLSSSPLPGEPAVLEMGSKPRLSSRWGRPARRRAPASRAVREKHPGETCALPVNYPCEFGPKRQRHCECWRHAASSPQIAGVMHEG